MLCIYVSVDIRRYQLLFLFSYPIEYFNENLFHTDNFSDVQNFKFNKSVFITIKNKLSIELKGKEQ